MANFLANFCELHFQRASRSTFLTIVVVFVIQFVYPHKQKQQTKKMDTHIFSFRFV